MTAELALPHQRHHNAPLLGYIEEHRPFGFCAYSLYAACIGTFPTYTAAARALEEAHTHSSSFAPPHTYHTA